MPTAENRRWTAVRQDMLSRMGFRIVPIDEAVAKEVRTTMLAPGYGHPAWTEVPQGSAPCRLCLEQITPGEEHLIGFTYDAFLGIEDLPLPGPIFVHARDCKPYKRTGEFPPQLGGGGLILDAYQHGRRLFIERRVTKPEVAEALDELLDTSDVDYIHVRSVTAGCFLCTAVPADHR